MAAIERTAYPRFPPALTASELQTLYAPTDEERARMVRWLRRCSASSAGWIGAYLCAAEAIERARHGSRTR